MVGDKAEGLPFAEIERSKFGLAWSRGVLKHSLEYRLQLAGRARYYLQHLRGCCLLLQRLAQIVGALAQLVEQPGVLDGDDRLASEVHQQLDLLVVESADLLADHRKRTDQFIVL